MHVTRRSTEARMPNFGVTMVIKASRWKENAVK